MLLYAEFGESHVVELLTHVLEVNDSKEWFQEEAHIKEMLSCLPGVLAEKACSLTPGQHSEKGAASLYSRSSGSLRMLFVFQVGGNSRQHIMKFTQYNKYDVVGGIAIMTAHGCRVLPYLPSRSPPSRESMEYIVFKEPLHVYMDTYGTASPNGVIKVLCELQPSHKRRQNIASYFTGESPDEPTSKRARPAVVKRKQKSPKQRNTLTQSFAPPKPNDSPSSSSALDLPSNAIDEHQYDFDSPVSSGSEESGNETPKTEHKAATSTETVSRPPSGSLSRSKEDSPEAEGSPADGAVDRRPSESAPPPGDGVSDSESDCSGYIDIQTPPVSAASPLHSRHNARLTTRPSPAASRLSAVKLGSSEVVEVLQEVTNAVSSSSSGQSIASSNSDLTLEPTTEELKLTEDDDVVLVKVSPKKKRKTKSVKKIFGDAKTMAELTPPQIRQWVKVHRDLLVDMWKSKVPSQRHDQFMEGPKSRARIKFLADTRMLTPPQEEALTDILLIIFCSRHMKYYNYVMSVLLPECVIRIIADFHNVSFDEAETMMRCYDEEEHPMLID